MVKLTGPALATNAGGRLAGTLTFSNWKGRGYLKKLTAPTQPRTKAQLGPRAMMTFLANAWQYLSAADKATWDDLAALTNIPPYNAYLAYNLERWADFHAPTRTYPATETADYSTYQNYTPHGMPRAVKHVWNYTTQIEGWGWLFHHLDSPTDPRRPGNLCHAHRAPTPGTYTWVQRGLTPGTHYFKAVNFSRDGKMRDYDFLRAATVTD